MGFWLYWVLLFYFLPLPSERAGAASQRASDHRGAAETNDDASVQEAGGAQGEERLKRPQHSWTLKQVHAKKKYVHVVRNVPFSETGGGRR